MIHYVAIAKVIFSHVKISSFRAKAHMVFHWCLYNKKIYFIPVSTRYFIPANTGGIIIDLCVTVRLV